MNESWDPSANANILLITFLNEYFCTDSGFSIEFLRILFAVGLAVLRN